MPAASKLGLVGFTMRLLLPNKSAFLSACALAFCIGAPAQAADQPVAIPIQGGQQVVIPQDQQLMLQAARMVMQRDYGGALRLYDQAIGMNPGNIEAYIERSVVKREMQNTAGSEADAAMAVRLSDAAITRDPKNPLLYYQRGMGYRFLRDFAHAKENVRYAMQISGGQHSDWETDLRAIELEEKMSQ